jgi:gas vesicle protein
MLDKKINIRNKYVNKLEDKIDDVVKSIQLLSKVDRKLFSQRGGAGGLYTLGQTIALLKAQNANTPGAEAVQQIKDNAAQLKQNINDNVEKLQNKMKVLNETIAAYGTQLQGIKPQQITLEGIKLDDIDLSNLQSLIDDAGLTDTEIEDLSKLLGNAMNNQDVNVAGFVGTLKNINDADKPKVADSINNLIKSFTKKTDAVDGAAVNGAAVDGAADNGAADNGTADNGAADNGTADNGAADNGDAVDVPADDAAAKNKYYKLFKWI